MVKSLSRERNERLVLDNNTLKSIYQHTRFLANFRFLRPVQVLQTRNTGYEIEDFVQEVVQKVCELFNTKTFPTMNHLKSMIRRTMEFHYLHEKRKYFYTKSRGNYSCASLDSLINDNRTLGDTVALESITCNTDDLYNFDIIKSRHLYVAYDWEKAFIIDNIGQFKNHSNKYLLSVNFFISKLREYGYRETCKYFKDNGFYMTRTICEQISTTIISYLKDNDYLSSDNLYSKSDIEKLEKCYNKSSDLIDEMPIKKLLKV